jgi:hypothetical protein
MTQKIRARLEAGIWSRVAVHWRRPTVTVEEVTPSACVKTYGCGSGKKPQSTQLRVGLRVAFCKGDSAELFDPGSPVL